MTSDHFIRIRGATQNNLKNISVDIPMQQLVVITGVSGSGKSSLAFDTLYAEGQRRYVETFSPYARQFLDRMDKPSVEHVEGIPPAIAIDQVNPVRNSRSTVGTMTELNDHLKLLFARASKLYCRGCAQPVDADTPDSIVGHLTKLSDEYQDPRFLICFPTPVPENYTEEEIQGYLERQGYTRIQATEKQKEQTILHVVHDRFRLSKAEPARLYEAIEATLKHGMGHTIIYLLPNDDTEAIPYRFNQFFHCARCQIEYTSVTPSHFSFNSPIGACDECRGFGRIIGIDYGLVIPDETKSLLEGVIKPWQTASYQQDQDALIRHAKTEGIPINTPWKNLTPEQQAWVLQGSPNFKNSQSWNTQWYGVERFFNWLETKAYKMHIRVLLSKYRSYTPCPQCQGSRLKHETLLWRLGTLEEANQVLPETDGRYQRFRPLNTQWGARQLADVPGLHIHDLMSLPIERVRVFIDQLKLPGILDAASEQLLTEIRSRLQFLCDVGLSYLSLDRQSRTLSGGEVQRINLTTALGTSLINTLFVLDEPSIGLHPKDMDTIVRIMHRLRDAGNSLVVVEHDPQIMMAADQIIDMGPGPGKEGGNILFQGSLDGLKQTHSLTGQYLSGRRLIDAPHPQAVLDQTPRLLLLGASEHNLKNINIEIPLGRLVSITGVSGSGKSTLIQNVLYPALLKKKGIPTEAPGKFERLLGDEQINEVVMVDQSPIGKTARSNPISYVGGFDAIRKIFAQAPLAKERAYTTAMFSFNAGNGRCPTCGGTGFEHVEMQFLSDVYLRCPDCQGTRFRAEIREVVIERHGQTASIADVLDMTIHEAKAFFSSSKEIQYALLPLIEVGLDYLKLGQPVPTLSGGEAQRLKLAGYLADAYRSGITHLGSKLAQKGSLFLFDEPTTGLHFDDIAKLMGAFRRLLSAGHSVIVIEHNLDVIGASDWVIDLGPNGGDDGGYLMAACSPQALIAIERSHTGQALKAYMDARLTPTHLLTESSLKGEYLGHKKHQRTHIQIQHAREHNLKNISVDIPLGKFTVVTGVSGSGKSTLAFDILFNEGQRRYLESLNAYARSIVQPASQPDVDSIIGIPPTVAIEQRTSRGGRKSTVGTMTELHHFLRLLYVKLGTQHCPNCQCPVEAQSLEQIIARLLTDYKHTQVTLLAPLVYARKGYYTDLAAWATQKGFMHLMVDGERVPTSPWPRLDRYKEHTIELPFEALWIDPSQESAITQTVRMALEYGKGILTVINDQGERVQFSTSRTCPRCHTSFPELDPRLFSYNSKHGWCHHCYGTGQLIPGFDEEQTGEEKTWTTETTSDSQACPDCNGQRLNPTALAVTWENQSIAELSRLSIDKASTFFNQLKLSGRALDIARDILPEIQHRLTFLSDVGVGYLHLDRAAPTLSGGEAQRIRLAAQLGSNLQGVCYVLDEPTIGLHPRDNHILLNALTQLRRHNNTLVIVEHDEDTIRRADHIIDIGPGAGNRGGQLVVSGQLDDLINHPLSATGQAFRHPLQHPKKVRRPVLEDTPSLVIKQATLHNLSKVDARLPLGRLNVLTGVSGSGKSTLARSILMPNLLSKLTNPDASWKNCEGLYGWESIDRVLEVDQTPIGKTPRSCPATYVGFWDTIRKQFSETAEAKMRGWTSARFSFNTGQGRCPICEGQGMRTIEMNFLPDVKVPCDSCLGQRFNRDTLSVLLREKHIGDVLNMEVDDAIPYFSHHPAVLRPLKLMQDVGLGYLTLGQASPTLSGGEAQRIKLVSELVKARIDEGVIRTGRVSKQPHTLYILDEPTVGLATTDIEKLIQVLHRLVDAGNTVLVIEHHLALMAEADWIIDMGPEGGEHGGQLVAQGSPQTLMKAKKHSHTGSALYDYLKK